MLYLVGLGLNDERDISLKGLEALKKCDSIYSEFYTSYFNGDLSNLEDLAGKKITMLSRADLEENPKENVFRDARDTDVALLVLGDPMVATTHVDILLRARKEGIKCVVIHSSSVYSAVAETGLQAYKFGRTASLVYPEKNYFPMSPYEILAGNLESGLHTLFLLDVKAEEKRFMTVGEAIELLLEMEKVKKSGIFSGDTLCIGVARLGGDVMMRSGRACDLVKVDYGKPPHCLVVPGKMHYIEEEALSLLG